MIDLFLHYLTRDNLSAFIHYKENSFLPKGLMEEKVHLLEFTLNMGAINIYNYLFDEFDLNKNHKKIILEV